MLTLKGADGGPVPAHVQHDALHHLPAAGPEEHLITHLRIGWGQQGPEALGA